jgi:dTMP kinase
VIDSFYILLEGPDGVSKTTLSNSLAAIYPNTEVFFDPGISKNHTDWEMMRNFVKNNKMHSVTETVMFFALRSELMSVVEHKLLTGCNVIQDRGFISTWVYQGLVKGNLDLVVELDRVLHFRKPDLTFILNAPFAVLNERLEKRNANIDKFKKSESFRKEVYKGYQTYIKLHRENDICVIDANRTQDEILKDCMREIQKRNLFQGDSHGK